MGASGLLGHMVEGEFGQPLPHDLVGPHGDASSCDNQVHPPGADEFAQAFRVVGYAGLLDDSSVCVHQTSQHDAVGIGDFATI